MARLPIPKIPGHEVVNSDDAEKKHDNWLNSLAIMCNKRYAKEVKEGRCQDDTQEEDYR